jgi:hypothetical protein
MTDTQDTEQIVNVYRGVDSPEAVRKAELSQRMSGHALKLMPCKPFLKGSRSRRHRQHTWVRT